MRFLIVVFCSGLIFGHILCTPTEPIVSSTNSGFIGNWWMFYSLETFLDNGVPNADTSHWNELDYVYIARITVDSMYVCRKGEDTTQETYCVTARYIESNDTLKPVNNNGQTLENISFFVYMDTLFRVDHFPDQIYDSLGESITNIVVNYKYLRCQCAFPPEN